MIFRFTPEADAELTEARQWYSHQRKGLDLDFMQSIDVALSRIRSNPRLFPVVHGGLRRAVVRHFPFAILYEVTTEQIQIIAVFHSRRNPDVWKSRVS
jgi:plasmid stabilization system protein ParE